MLAIHYRFAPICLSALAAVCVITGTAYADAPASTTAVSASASTGPEPATAAASDGGAKPFRMSAAALLGASTHGYGVGVGARLGATLSDHVYIGGTALYHFGRDSLGPGLSTNLSALQLGAEAGYAILVPPVIVRPYGGLGLVSYFVSDTSTDKNGVTTTASHNSLSAALWLGCTVAYRIANTPFGVGGDIRVLGPFDGAAALGIFATGSMTF